MNDLETLVRENQHLLQQAADLLKRISDKQYTNNDSPYFMSGVGKHIRHILGFYEQFLNGWPERIDYDARRRNAQLEKDRDVGGSYIKDVIHQLEQLPIRVDNPARQVRVKNDDSHPSDETYSHSTVARELQFLKSHTVHHYAMVAMILKVQGFEPPAEFGVAPSTLLYLKGKKAT